MKITVKTIGYLSGKIFSSGAKFFIDGQRMLTRDDHLCLLVKNKTVLHLGCADHTALIEKKRSDGRYLHDKIEKFSSKVIGCDVNYEAINKMKEIGIDNIYHVDEIPDLEYDYLLVPDVIEHIPNVETFLQSFKNYKIGKVVITTPNAFRLYNRKRWKYEVVNTDHRYWFSPYTLAKVVTEAGFIVDEVIYTDKYSKWRMIDNIKMKFFPLCRNGITLIASIK